MSSGIREAKPRPLDGKRPDKCRKWEIYANLGKGPDGKHKKVSRVVRGTMTEAKQAQRELRAKYSNVRAEAHMSGETFAEVAERWIRRAVAYGDITEATGDKKRHYLAAAGHHVGHMRLIDIDAPTLDDAYEALFLGDSPSGRKLSQTTVACVARTVNQFMNDMAKAGKIPPVAGLRTFSEKPKPRRALTHEEASDLVSRLDVGDHHHVAVALYLLAGLRRSEALTVTWGDYDQRANTLHVHGTKSEAADAVLPLRRELSMILDQWREIQSMRLELYGARLTPRTPIVSMIGEEVTADNIKLWWRRHRADLGFEGLRLHELRHTFVTECARAGLPTTVTASLARDKSTRVVEEVYTHIGIEEKKRAVCVLDTVL